MSTIGRDLDEALYAKLTGASSVTSLLESATAVYGYIAPQNAGHPFVIFRDLDDAPVWRLNGKAYEAHLYEIRAVTEGNSFAIAADIDAAIESLLNDGTLTVDGHGLMYIRKESGLPPFPEVAEGQRYNHKGSLYRIWLRPE